MRVTEVQFSRRSTKQQKASLQNNWPHDNTCRHFQYRCCRRQVSYKLNLMNVNETFIRAPSHKQIKMQADILWATGLKRVLYGYISIYSTYISVYSTVIQLCCEYTAKFKFITWAACFADSTVFWTNLFCFQFRSVLWVRKQLPVDY